MGLYSHRPRRFLYWTIIFSIVLLWLICVLLIAGKAKPQATNSLSKNKLRQNNRKEDTHLLPTIPTKEIAPNVYMPVISIGAGGTQKRRAYEIVDNWLKQGGVGIDTALAYKNQPDIASVIKKDKDRRNNVFVTTKIPDCDTSKTKDYIQQSLNELETNYIDLVLIHAPRRGNCVETWKVLENYHEQETIRAIGVSNFRKEDLKPILQQGKIIPAVNQIWLNMGHIDTETVSFSEQHGITIQAFRPLERGDKASDKQMVVQHPTVRSIATQHNVTPYQIALQWILQHGWILAFQSVSKEHQQQNVDLTSLRLTPHEMEELDKISKST